MNYESFQNQRNKLGNLYNVKRKSDGKEVLRGATYNKVIDLIGRINTFTKSIFIDMRYWKEETPLQVIGSLIWNTSEFLKIPLGRFAPIVFGWMIGHKGTKL